MNKFFSLLWRGRINLKAESHVQHLYVRSNLYMSKSTLRKRVNTYAFDMQKPYSLSKAEINMHFEFWNKYIKLDFKIMRKWECSVLWDSVCVSAEDTNWQISDRFK